jgi:ppGpp synthetase/RelA/SpoT-type nucleotidyltranferase/predicted ABC-type ATPase
MCREYLEEAWALARKRLPPWAWAQIHQQALPKSGNRASRERDDAPSTLEKVALRDIQPRTLQELPEDDLRQTWLRLHQWYASAQRKGRPVENLVNATLWALDEMKRRGLDVEDSDLVKAALAFKEASLASVASSEIQAQAEKARRDDKITLGEFFFMPKPTPRASLSDVEKFDPDQSRDDAGRFGSGGSGAKPPKLTREDQAQALKRDYEGRAQVPTKREWVEGKQPDTWEDHFDKDPEKGGKPSKERIAEVHQPIVDEALGAATSVPAGEQPTAILTMGGPASGKSSGLATFDKSNTVHVDADAIKEQMPEYIEGVRGGLRDSARMAHNESSYIAKQIRERAIADRKNLIYDGTGRNREPFEETIDKLKAKGYKVTVMMSDLTVEEGLARAQGRAERISRYVPDDAVKGAYQTIPKNFEHFAAKADSWVLFDNHGDKPRAVWTGSGGKTAINDPAYVESFKARARSVQKSILKFDPDQPRDEGGRFGSGGGNKEPSPERKLPAGKTLEEHREIARKTIEFHKREFANEKERLEKTVGPDAAVKGRVKDEDSVLDKLERKPKYDTADKLQDMTGLRVTVGSLDEVRDRVERIKAEYDVVTEDNYNENPRGNYRSHHLIVRGEAGQEMEIQVKTRNQDQFGRWAHNIYKPVTEAHARNYQHADVKKYETGISEYFWDRDNGREGSKPPCYRLVQESFGCL